MKRSFRLVPVIGLMLVGTLLLSGCQTIWSRGETPAPGPSVDATPTPEPMPQGGGNEEEVDETELSSECIEFFEQAGKGDPIPAGARAAYNKRMAECLEDPTAGAMNSAGELEQLPLYTGDGNIFTVDSTSNTSTPPLIVPTSYGVLDGALRYQNITKSWAELVERVEGQPDHIRQAYIDGINKYASESGFDWKDVLAFAKMDDVEARIIQVFNIPVSEMSDDQVREAVRPYMEDAANNLQIVRYAGQFVNTTNIGKNGNLVMGKFADGQRMIRVSLTPILLDDKNKPVLDANGKRQLDVSRGAGIFIDCLNLHWVPPTYVCTDSSCKPPACPPGQTGRWPICKDSASNDPGANGTVPPWGIGWSPGVTEPAGPAKAGNPPGVYTPPPAPTPSPTPTGSTPDPSPAPEFIEGKDGDKDNTECVPGFGITCP